jgi:aminocarboxymuconate-semialdehyde decarboxylase
MIVDAHAHIIVPEITRDVAAEPWRPRVFWQDGKQIIEFGGRQIRSAVWEITHLDGILDHMTGRGVDRVLLSPWISLVRYNVPLEEALRSSRIQNAALAEIVRTRPDRVAALGTVPLQAPDVAARELEILMGEDLSGVAVAAFVNGAPVGDDRFRPFWAAAERSGALVFHPTIRGFDLAFLEEYYLWNTIGNPLETTLAAAQMVMAGVMEAHPRLRVLLAHGGGALLALRGRLRHAHTFQPQARARLQESPEDSLRRFYFDTVTHDPVLLRALIEFAGADHVLLGSDYPFDMGVEWPVEAVRALGLVRSDQAKILGGNAARLLRFRAGSPAAAPRDGS